MARPVRVALVGAFGPAQMACIQSWSRRRLEIVFCHLSDGAPLSFSRKLLTAYRQWPEGALGDATQADDIARWISVLGCDAAVTVAYLASVRLAAALGDQGSRIAIAAPDSVQLDFLNTKSAQIDAAAAAGLAVDDYWLLRTEEDAGAIPRAAYPLVLRPDHPAAARPAFKAELFDDFEALSAFLKPRRPPFGIVAQRFVNAPNLVVHGSRKASGEPGPMAGFIVDYKFEGVTQRIRPVPLPDVLAARCRAFVEAAGLVGVYHFEFLAAAALEESLFLEINGRLGGTTGKVVHFGYDEPALLLESLGLAAGSVPAALSASMRPVSNRLSLAKRLKGSLGTRRDRLDYPVLSAGAAFVRLGGGMIAWRDETMSGRSWRLVADYWRELLA